MSMKIEALIINNIVFYLTRSNGEIGYDKFTQYCAAISAHLNKSLYMNI